MSSTCPPMQSPLTGMVDMHFKAEMHAGSKGLPFLRLESGGYSHLGSLLCAMWTNGERMPCCISKEIGLEQVKLFGLNLGDAVHQQAGSMISCSGTG
jgi:hypothetical protein